MGDMSVLVFCDGFESSLVESVHRLLRFLWRKPYTILANTEVKHLASCHVFAALRLVGLLGYSLLITCG